MTHQKKFPAAGDGREPPERHRSNNLKLLTLVNLIVANMIGAGVFTTSGFALADLGSPDLVMLAWLIGGAVALCGAISYGGLAGYLAESGGEYLFLSRFIHPLVGFVAGWVSLLAGFTGAIAFAALAFEAYASPLLPVVLPAGVPALLLVAAAAALHGARVTIGVKIQNAVVFLKLGLLLVFLGLAFVWSPYSHSAAPASVPPAAGPAAEFSILALAGSLVWISLSYSGFNAAVYVAGEANRAQVNIPRAIWIGTLAVTAIYLALNAVFMYLAPAAVTTGREDVAAAAAYFIGGEALALLLRSIIALSLLTSVFAMVMTGPRIYARMADDGLFPAFFRFRSDVPRAAIALQAVAAALVIAFASLKDLLSYLGFTLSLCAALTVSCTFLLKRREDRSGGSFRFPGYPLVPAFFVGTTLLLAGLAVWRSPSEIIATLLTVVTGAAFYYLARRRATKSETAGPEGV